MLLATHHSCKAGVFAGAALAFLLQSLGLAPLLAGVVTLIALASLPLRWRHQQNRAGVFTLALASFPLLCWRLPNCNAVTRCRHRAGILLVLHRHSWVHRAGVIVGIGWRHHQHCIGVFALFLVASLL
jgi:hypothetical protein